MLLLRYLLYMLFNIPIKILLFPTYKEIHDGTIIHTFEKTTIMSMILNNNITMTTIPPNISYVIKGSKVK